MYLIWTHCIAFALGAYLEKQRTKAIVKELFDLFKKDELKKIKTLDIDE